MILLVRSGSQVLYLAPGTRAPAEPGPKIKAKAAALLKAPGDLRVVLIEE